MKTKQCTRCVGTGKVGNYAHVKGGVCFKCNGTGKQVVMKNERQQKVWWQAVDELGNRVDRKTQSEAEAIASAWRNMGLDATVIMKTSEVTIKVPA